MSEKDKPRIQWSATEIVGIGIDNPERVRKTEDGNTVLMPTGVVDECDNCFGKLVDLDKMVPGVTYTGGKAHGHPALPPCPKCIDPDGKPTGKKHVGVSLADLPRRGPKEEVCEHCGAIYTGLFHCQSLSQIKEIDDPEFIAAIQRAVEEMSDELE